jgi:hypothetical protein
MLQEMRESCAMKHDARKEAPWCEECYLMGNANHTASTHHAPRKTFCSHKSGLEYNAVLPEYCGRRIKSPIWTLVLRHRSHVNKQ